MKKYLITAVVVWSWVLGVALSSAQPSSPNSLSGEKIIIGANTGVQIYNKGSGEISLRSNINSASYGLSVNDTTVELGKNSSGTAWVVEADGDFAPGTTGGDIVLSTTSGLVYPVVNGLTAAGTTRGTATALTRVINNVGTVAAGTGVSLWDCPLGTSIVVTNNGANPLNVYTHNDASSVNGIGFGGLVAAVLPPGSGAEFFHVTSATWTANISGTSAAAGSALTAAGTVITDALDLVAPYNNVTTVGSGAGVQLYEAAIGSSITVRNSGNAQLNVYPPTASGVINELAAGTAFPLNVRSVAVFKKITSTIWIAELGASQGFENGITAAGTIITDAYDLTRPFNGVGTVAAGSGVQLYQAPVGVPVVVRNGGLNPLNVYPADASSNINGGTNGAAVVINPTDTITFTRITAGAWFAHYSKSNSVFSAVSAAGSTVADATLLSRHANIVTTVASGTGVVVYDGFVGTEISVQNEGANNLLVYAPSGSTINGGASITLTAANDQAARIIKTGTTEWIATIVNTL